jgi:hypothetical protein
VSPISAIGSSRRHELGRSARLQTGRPVAYPVDDIRRGDTREINMLAVTLLGVTISGREILIIVVIVAVVAIIAWFMTQRRRPR